MSADLPRLTHQGFGIEVRDRRWRDLGGVVGWQVAEDLVGVAQGAGDAAFERGRSVDQGLGARAVVQERTTELT